MFASLDDEIFLKKGLHMDRRTFSCRSKCCSLGGDPIEKGDKNANGRVASTEGGGRVVRRCRVNFQCRGVLLSWITVGQGPIVLAVGAGLGLFGHFFSHLLLLFSFSLSLGDGPI